MLAFRAEWSWDGVDEAAFRTLVRNFGVWCQRNGDPRSVSADLFSILFLRRSQYGKLEIKGVSIGAQAERLVDEHVAELLGAERKFDRAIALYEAVLARLPRPELQQALGDLLRSMGREAQATPWHDRALAGYLESAERGEVHYYHHLAGFYADVRLDGAEAVKWARRDVDLRPSFFTQDALAWALYRDGQFADALDTVQTALASGANDTHLLFHAAMIHLAAGRTAEGKRLLDKVARLNPGFESFHVHR